MIFGGDKTGESTLGVGQIVPVSTGTPNPIVWFSAIRGPRFITPTRLYPETSHFLAT